MRTGESTQKAVVTAIRSAEFEGFVASTLFHEGWSVSYRALDIHTLLTFLDDNSNTFSLVLISTDLEGLTLESLELIKSKGVRFFLFTSPTSLERFPESIAQPATSLELLGIIRGSLRAPMIHEARREKVRARTIALASPSPMSGCSTLTINLGTELVQLGNKVLIVDAHPFFPTFAFRLGARGITDCAELRNISAQLWALEVRQSDISGAISALERARFEFDYIIIDQGIIQDFPAILTSRRWSSEVFIWVTTYADELWVLSKTDLISIERLKNFTTELGRNSIKPFISFIQSHSPSPKRRKLEEEIFLQIVTPLRPKRVLQYPWDARGVLAAELENCTLMESHERGILRKSIAHIAGELTS